MRARKIALDLFGWIAEVRCVQKHGEAGDDECNDRKGGAENGSQVVESERAEDMFSAC